MSSQTFSTFSEVGMIDARGQNGIITLPLTTDIPYRILTLKDIYGAAAVSSITLTTQGADVFEDGTTSRLLNNPDRRPEPETADKIYAATGGLVSANDFFNHTSVRVSVEGPVGTGNMVATKVRDRPARTPR
jgi:hypothetical protein